MRAAYNETWDRRDFDAGAALMSDDGEVILAGTGQTFRGPEGAKEYSRIWAEGFPDGRITIDRVIEAGETVTVEAHGDGTHTGTLRSAMGEIPATGKTVHLEFCDVHDIRSGKIARTRTYIDSGSLMAQLGLMPEPSQTAHA